MGKSNIVLCGLISLFVVSASSLHAMEERVSASRNLLYALAEEYVPKAKSWFGGQAAENANDYLRKIFELAVKQNDSFTVDYILDSYLNQDSLPAGWTGTLGRAQERATNSYISDRIHSFIETRGLAEQIFQGRMLVDRYMLNQANDYLNLQALFNQHALEKRLRKTLLLAAQYGDMFVVMGIITRYLQNIPSPLSREWIVTLTNARQIAVDNYHNDIVEILGNFAVGRPELNVGSENAKLADELLKESKRKQGAQKELSKLAKEILAGGI